MVILAWCRSSRFQGGLTRLESLTQTNVRSPNFLLAYKMTRRRLPKALQEVHIVWQDAYMFALHLAVVSASEAQLLTWLRNDASLVSGYSLIFFCLSFPPFLAPIFPDQTQQSHPGFPRVSGQTRVPAVTDLGFSRVLGAKI